MTRTGATLVLVVQLLVRICCTITTVGMLTTTAVWHDAFLLQFCGVFSVSLAGLILCLFFRVYRVTLAAFPSTFPTVLHYWGSGEYCSLLISNSIFSLLFYYYSITAAYRVGSMKTIAPPQPDLSGDQQIPLPRPSAFAAVQLASRRSYG